MMRALGSGFAFALFVLTGCATPVTTLADGKTGSIEFESLTFPAEAGGVSGLMVRDESAKKVMTQGQLRLPKGEGRVAAVILMHGCSGVTQAQETWASELGSMGVATLLVDSFGGRSVIEVCSARTRVSSLDYLSDAYRALGLLVTHPRIDPARVAILGFSLGGRTALWSSYARFRTRWSGSGEAQFAAHLAFYPAVSWYKLVGDDDIGERPIRIFQGGSDDWTPAATIERYVDRVRTGGHKNISLVLYGGAHHGFDSPQAPNPPIRVSDAANLTKCLFVEQPDGRFVDSDTGRPAGIDVPCASRGVTVGQHPQARVKAMNDVKAFLAEAFRMP